MSERIAKDKMKKYLDEAFSLNCVFTKNIILVRYQTSRRSMFHRGQKLIGPEEFRENVLEEFEKGVSSLQSDVSEELQVMAKKIVDEVKNGSRPRFQKMIDDSYSQFLRESRAK